MAAALAMKTTSKLKRLANVGVSPASYQQKWAHAEQQFPATILTRRLANEKRFTFGGCEGNENNFKTKKGLPGQVHLRKQNVLVSNVNLGE